MTGLLGTRLRAAFSVTIDGDTLVLESSSAQERTALVEAYISRHEVK